MGGQSQWPYWAYGRRSKRSHPIYVVQWRVSGWSYSCRYCYQWPNCNCPHSFNKSLQVSTTFEEVNKRFSNIDLQYICGYRSKDVPVYNITCTEGKKLTWGEVLEQGKEMGFKYPFEAGIWYPGGSITTNKIVHTLTVIFCHWLPAYFIDFLMFLLGQKRL